MHLKIEKDLLSDLDWMDCWCCASMRCDLCTVLLECPGEDGQAGQDWQGSVEESA